MFSLLFACVCGTLQEIKLTDFEKYQNASLTVTTMNKNIIKYRLVNCFLKKICT